MAVGSRKGGVEPFAGCGSRFRNDCEKEGRVPATRQACWRRKPGRSRAQAATSQAGRAGFFVQAASRATSTGDHAAAVRSSTPRHCSRQRPPRRPCQAEGSQRQRLVLTTCAAHSGWTRSTSAQVATASSYLRSGNRPGRARAGARRRPRRAHGDAPDQEARGAVIAGDAALGPVAGMQVSPEQGAFLTILDRAVGRGGRRDRTLQVFGLCIARGLPRTTAASVLRRFRRVDDERGQAVLGEPGSAARQIELRISARDRHAGVARRASRPRVIDCRQAELRELMGALDTRNATNGLILRRSCCGAANVIKPEDDDETLKGDQGVSTTRAAPTTASTSCCSPSEPASRSPAKSKSSVVSRESSGLSEA